MTKLSVIIPVYNEEKTLKTLVERVQRADLGKVKKEIIIVNDASHDNSLKIIKSLAKRYKNIKYHNHSKNKGKGAAIITAIHYITGDFLIVQDGDLEYNPEDYKKLIQPLLEDKADIVCGSRVKGHITGFQIPLHYYGNLFLTWVTRLLYHQGVSDLETGYKMMKAPLFKNLKLKSKGFEIDPEYLAKILKKRYRYIEVPISYNARSFAEGKKITWKDGVIALYTLFKYRFID